MKSSTDIRVEDLRFEYEDYTYRTPIKFGGVALDRVTMLNVTVLVRTVSGVQASGFGSMPLSNVWAFPSKKLTYEQTLGAMKAVAEKVAKITRQCKDYGHPLDLNHLLEKEYLRGAEAVTREEKLADPIPVLATLVVASPFDAAIHDAFGKVHGLNCYHTYGPDFVHHDLGHYLGKEFKGLQLQSFILKEPQDRMPLYHLVGALDPLDDAEVVKRVGDGLPETLAEWIPFNGLTHIKIKLNGDDLAWDVGRVVKVDRVSQEAQEGRGVQTWHYSLDFNEKCPNVAYLLEFLALVKSQRPAAFERVQYIEQPTARDLKTHRDNLMHEAAKLRPVVIDESLIDLESMMIAREMGYTGAALKGCKGQSQSLLMAAVAQKFGMFLCVQDLTCPGASLIHSAGLAAHVPGVAAIEHNSRQYVPSANKPWEAKFPGIFRVTDGTLHTGCLTGLGLGAV